MNTVSHKKNSALENNHQRIVHFLPEKKMYAECIVNISSNRCYVYSDCNINDLADELIEYPSIAALGVVDKSGQLLGTISRKNLFAVLGKQYGRDLYKTKSVDRILSFVPVFTIFKHYPGPSF